MSERANKTYCGGFELTANKNISKKEFILLCDNLKYKFNEYYDTDEFSFKPEQITEGGIVFENFNTCLKNAYKTMRIYFINDGRITPLYGCIPVNVKQEWKDNDDILILQNQRIGTFLKSFGDAPEWTNQELQIFKKCFACVGLTITRLPKKWLKKESYKYKYYNELFHNKSYKLK